MPEDDNTSLIGLILSGILGFYSFLRGNAFLQWLGAVLFGAFITYFVQSRLQSKAERNRIRKRNIEEIFAPMYLEIKNIRESLLDFPKGLQELMAYNPDTREVQYFSWNHSWKDISQSYKRFVLGDKLEKTIRDYYLKIDEHNSQISEAKVYINKRIQDIFESNFIHLFHTTEKKLPRSSPNSFYLEYEKTLWGKESVRDIDSYVLKGLNILEELRNDPHFPLEKCTITYWIRDESNGGKEERVQVNLDEHLQKFNQVMKVILENINQNSEILKIRAESKKLSEISENIEKTLLEHITKYYPLEKIRLFDEISRNKF